MFEFLRNNALDAPNYFDQGSAPPFQRNQFGGSMGGPIQQRQDFLLCQLRRIPPEPAPDFGGFRSGPGVAGKPLRPACVRCSTCGPRLAPAIPTSAASPRYSSSPLQTIREDFGTTRLDHIFSQRDTLSRDLHHRRWRRRHGHAARSFSSDILNLREQVLSLEETHVFSPALLNTARFGFSRAGYFFTGEPTPGTPAASVPGFLVGHPVGAVVVGGSAASNPQAQLGLAGSNNGSNLRIARNLFTVRRSRVLDSRTPSAQLRRMAPAFPVQRDHRAEPVWAGHLHQPADFSAGTISSFLYDPSPTEMNWRSLFGAWYAEDAIRLSPKSDGDSGLSRRIHDWLERGPRPGRQLHASRMA